MDPNTLSIAVNAKYSSLARQTLSTAVEDSNRTAHDLKASSSFGYSASDLAPLPSGTNLGLSCGAPLGLARLQPGEHVLDLGSGGGLDSLLAARAVGAAGRVVGLDRSPDMVQLARRNAERMGVDGCVKFVEGDIVQMPLGNSEIDVVLSNCVLNLVPQAMKHRAFEEMFRVLRPGGRVAVSDVLAKRELPAQVRRDVALVVGCVAGASLVAEYEAWMKSVGFVDVGIVATGADLNVFKGECCVAVECEGDVALSSSCGTKATGCCRPTDEEKSDEGTFVGQDMNFNDWVGPYEISAIKPGVT